MSGGSRKVRNPLLSAAGEGFPFENLSENTFLLPVTPATPALIRDDAADLDNFVGQETTNSQSNSASQAKSNAENEFTPIPLHSEESKSPTAQPPSTKQGYLTSILSSLPNLSLSSITGDSSASQPAEVPNAKPFVPSFDRRETLREAAPPIFHDPRRTDFGGSAEVNLGNSGSGGNLPPPPQNTLPPTVSSTNNGPLSYRLGNQRRLKYAPPPDLTLNTSKHYSSPITQPLFTPPTSNPTTIFNPNEPLASSTNFQPLESIPPPLTTNSPPVQRSTPEFLSQTNSLQESVRSSPVASAIGPNSSGTSRSITPQSQPQIIESVTLNERPNLCVSSSRSIPYQIGEPLTPQNTPATLSYFAFDSSPREFPAKPHKTEGEPIEAPTPILKSSKKSETESKPTVSFAPVSAAQVSQKLEHLLAEREEDFSAPGLEVSSKLPEEEIRLPSPEESKLGEFAAKEEQNQVKSEKLEDQIDTKEAEERIGEEIAQLSSVEQSHGVPSKLQPLQYFTSSPDFFFEKPANQNSIINQASSCSSASNLTFGDSKKAFVQSASVFFDSPASSNTFARLEPKESSRSGSVPEISARREDLGSNFGGQQTWSGNQENATCNAPLFYNPAQFQADLPVDSFTSAGFNSLGTGQASNYFSGLNSLSGLDHFCAKSAKTSQESGIGVEFLGAQPLMTAVPELTGSATLNPVQMSVNPIAGRVNADNVPPSFQNLAAGASDRRMQQYRGVYHHWFYRKKVEHKVLWLPFSMQDSLRLEEVHNSTEITPETTVATDGGRYDVDILRRQRSPVYWIGDSTEVRRCSWFFKGPTESRFVPYDESTAAKLEEEYKQACLSNNWNRRIDFSNGEYIIFHSAAVQVHYLTAVSPELAASWGNSAGSEDSTYLQGAGSRPRVIKRGLDEFHIEDGEPEKVDHLLFLVHGIGSVCDLKFRSVEEVVDEFRSISLQLVQSHYRTASEQRIVNRIEVLPISWHTTLHSEDTGIDKKLTAITLESIPKLRHFTNDTLLDILFYTSPVYCQTIMQTVGNEINRLHALFQKRNPDFDGGIYLGGHSLGSLILFDLLCHQKPLLEEKNSENDADSNEEQKQEEAESSETPTKVLKRRLSKKISYVIGSAGTGQPYIQYPQLHFHPRAFFALGSPIGMFVTVRGIDMLGEDFELPTCPAFFNIFHPFDPVAYRVEALINPDAPKYRPMLIPHHKGRKRMHLELKETMARVGADLKQKLLDSVRNTWNSVYQLAVFHKTDNSTLERAIDEVMEEQLQQTPPVADQQGNEDFGAEFKVGKLNGGRRIDYVLQEAPFEYINEYIFALTSHVCYWESEDTMLMILKEIYGSTGIQTDAQLPQQTLSIERVTPSPSLISMSSRCDGRSSPVVPVMGMDPTAPVSEKTVGPPPKTGFVKKS